MSRSALAARLLTATLPLTLALRAEAQTPTLVDPDLTITASPAFADAQSARFDPRVRSVSWVARRGASG